MYRLENWAVHSEGDPYQPPEAMRIYLSGEVYGHDKRPDGQRITTSYLLDSEGAVVTTMSGSKYRLGQPSEDYVKYYREQFGKEIDLLNPIKIRRL